MAICNPIGLRRTVISNIPLIAFFVGLVLCFVGLGIISAFIWWLNFFLFNTNPDPWQRFALNSLYF